MLADRDDAGHTGAGGRKPSMDETARVGKYNMCCKFTVALT